MNTLIDTSAWIEFLRPNGNRELKVRVAELLAAKRAAYTCPVAFELYAGVRKNEVAMLDEALSFAQRIEVSPADWDSAGGSAAQLRAKSIKVPASDLLIATVAAKAGLTVLCRDQHFALIRDHVLPVLQLG